MAEVLSFMDVKRQKDFELEKNLLKELSLRQIIQSVKDCLEPLFPFLHDERDIITEGCIDFAIEAYLLGGRFGIFGYYGESMQSISARSAREEEELRMEFFDYLYNWIHEQYATFDKTRFMKRHASSLKIGGQRGLFKEKNSVSFACGNHISRPVHSYVITDKREGKG